MENAKLSTYSNFLEEKQKAAIDSWYSASPMEGEVISGKNLWPDAKS